MKVKTLEKLMTFTEAKDYVFTHPEYRLPTKEEADEMDNWFPHWIDAEPFQVENALIVKTNLTNINILFKNKVVLVKVKTAIEIPLTVEMMNNFRRALINNEPYSIYVDEQEYKFVIGYKE